MNFSAKSIELKTYLLAATTVILVTFPGCAGEVYLNNHCQRGTLCSPSPVTVTVIGGSDACMSPSQRHSPTH